MASFAAPFSSTPSMMASFSSMTLLCGAAALVVLLQIPRQVHRFKMDRQELSLLPVLIVLIALIVLIVLVLTVVSLRSIIVDASSA